MRRCNSFFGFLVGLATIVAVLLVFTHMRPRMSGSTSRSVSVAFAPLPETKAAPGDEKKAAPAGEVKPAERKPGTWTVEGKWKTTPEEAKQSFREAAAEELQSYLAVQSPPVEWSLDETKKFLLTHENKLLTARAEDRDFGGNVGTLTRRVGDLKLPPSFRQDVIHHDQGVRMSWRMLWLARVMVGLVMLLGVTAAYFRLDEVTKGYYTGWLRLAAAGCLGATVVALVVLA